MSTSAQFHRDQHYVPNLYLKRFAAADGRVYTYQLLVAHPRVPVWKPRQPKSIAYHRHLYTRLLGGEECDDFERWLDREVEQPAEEAIEKVVSDQRLSTRDWERLVRFFAAQDVRTPARYVQNLERWSADIPDLLDSTMRQSVAELEAAKRSGEVLDTRAAPHTEYLPLRVCTELEPGSDYGTVKAEIVVGRELWLSEIRDLLSRTARVLLEHRWTILTFPADAPLFTSDDPVVKLNHYGGNSYDFKGEWNNSGTELMLPLSPTHLMYTQVGRPVPRRGELVGREMAGLIRRMVAEHAFRSLFAASPDADVPRFRPRAVDRVRLQEETASWKRFHAEQVAAERDLWA